ncbi:MAG: S41 family peptidase [Bdellovibrionia bacterium]
MAIFSFGSIRKNLIRNASFKSLVVCATVIAGALGTVACDPAADHVLTTEDKVADMQWLFSIFRNNYAPLEYKEARNGYDIERLQKVYMTKAKRTKSNDEFYRVMAQFVAEFKDAHTAGSISPASVPGQAKIAYLGISGVRDGKNFRVTDIIPSIDRSNFPIEVSEKITAIDGVPLFEYIDKNLVPYRNLGNDLANKTVHMKNLFTRMSLTLPIPEKDDVKLTVQNPITGKTRTVTLPWIKKDLYDFKLERALFDASRKTDAKTLSVSDPHTGGELSLAILDQRGVPMSVKDLIETYQGGGKKDFLQTFKLQTPSAIELTTKKSGPETAPMGMEKLKTERAIPEGAISIEDAKAFPAYVYAMDVKDANGKVRAKKRVGYVRIAEFEVQVPEQVAVDELRATLKKFKQFGVTNVIVDTIDNPGGSLSLLAKVAQAFSDKPVKQPEMRFGLNDNWLLELQQSAIDYKNSDEQRERARRIYEKLRAEKNEGKRLSSLYNVSDIVTDKNPPNEGVHFNKIVVLVSEMNASCGDIFPAIMQDNGLAVIAGTNTMGAGGNVVDHTSDQAPNGHFAVRQTESLIVRKDGSYLENNGVKPDIEFDVNATMADKYRDALTKAEEIIADKRIVPKALAERRKALVEDADERASRRQGELTGERAKSEEAKAVERAIRAGEYR